jgi:hypothetical protein
VDRRDEWQGESSDEDTRDSSRPSVKENSCQNRHARDIWDPISNLEPPGGIRADRKWNEEVEKTLESDDRGGAGREIDAKRAKAEVKSNREAQNRCLERDECEQ